MKMMGQEENNSPEGWVRRGQHAQANGADAQQMKSGIYSYYWPNATYVHCAPRDVQSECKPLVLDAKVYEGRLPDFLYKEHVNQDNMVVIPCGNPIPCNWQRCLRGPFGPLSLNNSENVGVVEGTIEWHPILYSDCRSPGVHAHAVLACVACIVLLPMAFSALARKPRKNRRSREVAEDLNGKPSTSVSTSSSLLLFFSSGEIYRKAMIYTHAGGILLVLISSVVISAKQTYVASLPECQNTGAGLRTHHGVLGWFCISLLLAERLVHYLVSNSNSNLCNNHAVRDIVAVPVAKVFSLLPLLVKPLVGFRMSGNSFKLTTLLALTFGCVLSGMWETCDCYEYSHFVAQEIGHMTYSLLWIILSGWSLTYNHPSPRLRLKHTFQEGVFLLFGGLLSVLVVTTGTGGGIFYSGRTMSNQSAESQEFMKDLQHTVQAGVWATAGFMDVCLAKIGIPTGLPFLLATLCHGSMVLLHGHQANPLALLGHKLHAYAMLTAGVMRFIHRLPEFSFFLTLAATLFIASSKCMASWAHTFNFDPISYYLCVVVITAVLWSWLVFTCTDTNRSLRALRMKHLGGSFYTSEELENKFVVAPSSEGPGRSKAKSIAVDIEGEALLEMSYQDNAPPAGCHEY
jgi:hypothetical protein